MYVLLYWFLEKKNDKVFQNLSASYVLHLHLLLQFVRVWVKVPHVCIIAMEIIQVDAACLEIQFNFHWQNKFFSCHLRMSSVPNVILRILLCFFGFFFSASFFSRDNCVICVHVNSRHFYSCNILCSVTFATICVVVSFSVAIHWFYASLPTSESPETLSVVNMKNDVVETNRTGKRKPKIRWTHFIPKWNFGFGPMSRFRPRAVYLPFSVPVKIAVNTWECLWWKKKKLPFIVFCGLLGVANFPTGRAFRRKGTVFVGSLNRRSFDTCLLMCTMWPQLECT